ncbi:hypothetical protein NS220_03290 [Microbacterium testaceum]|uniref:Uncharacterized protein n=1 Tax=Microbacterium testaceum TaxID=2033 RepID=A0A147F055_MICTE|nr:hypothetical protein [Microbacterium testaceum]KTR96113.1 hypothetical protein NS220_03290 [Microbacterium testaceum]
MTDTNRPGAGVVWARVEEGFHVGSRNGVFLGYLDREADGSYLAYNGRSRLVGRFPTLVAGMAAVTSATDDALPPSRREEEVVLRQVRTDREIPGSVVQ